jgi:hypothetical protein
MLKYYLILNLSSSKFLYTCSHMIGHAPGLRAAAERGPPRAVFALGVALGQNLAETFQSPNNIREFKDVLRSF